MPASADKSNMNTRFYLGRSCTFAGCLLSTVK